MGLFQLSSIKIKSSVNNYKVTFNDSIFEKIKSEYKHGDIIIIDENVFKYFEQKTKKLIINQKHILIKATEEQKSYIKLSSIIQYLIKNNFRRNNRLFAIGGGITQDIVGFVSSVIFRGVKWFFFPSTLLSQADSCIGGKTSINIGKYKNQLGNFYPPEKIFIIPSLLKTLKLNDIKSGLGEMLHFYLVSGEKDFKIFQDYYENSFNDNDALLHLIKRNLKIKKRFIEIDEFDTGERILLNYGHSFGHAIESLTNYDIPHGIAVSYGMGLANFISLKLGFIDINLFNRIQFQLEKVYSGIALPIIDVRKFEIALSRDKKNIGNTYQLILTKGIGKMLKYGIEPNITFTSWIKEYFKNLNLK